MGVQSESEGARKMEVNQGGLRRLGDSTDIMAKSVEEVKRGPIRQ